MYSIIEISNKKRDWKNPIWHILTIKKGMNTMTMTKISYSGLKYKENDVEINLLVDIQNDWFEVTHTKEVSQVMNKSTGEYIIVNRNSLKCEAVS